MLKEAEHVYAELYAAKVRTVRAALESTIGGERRGPWLCCLKLARQLSSFSCLKCLSANSTLGDIHDPLWVGNKKYTEGEIENAMQPRKATIVDDVGQKQMRALDRLLARVATYVGHTPEPTWG